MISSHIDCKGEKIAHGILLVVLEPKLILPVAMFDPRVQ